MSLKLWVWLLGVVRGGFLSLKYNLESWHLCGLVSTVSWTRKWIGSGFDCCGVWFYSSFADSATTLADSARPICAAGLGGLCSKIVLICYAAIPKRKLNTKSNMLTLCSGKGADLGLCTKQKVVPYQLSSAYTFLCCLRGFFHF